MFFLNFVILICFTTNRIITRNKKWANFNFLPIFYLFVFVALQMRQDGSVKKSRKAQKFFRFFLFLFKQNIFYA